MKAGLRIACIAAVLVFAWLAAPADAATLAATRNGAITWLERNQNGDGSWGQGSKRWIATSEAVLALARAGRASSVAARRGQGWLLHNHTPAIDPRARKVRALAASGVYVRSAALALDANGGANGWGVVAGSAVTSYDTALALGALAAAGVPAANGAQSKAEVLARLRADSGWSGDGVPYLLFVSDTLSDLTSTAEILRGLVGSASSGEVQPPLVRIAGDASLDETTPSLEVAARLAAKHAWGVGDEALETELLADARLSGGVWSASDPLVNAIGLLALVTRPGTVPPSCSDDADLDGYLDCNDAFPNDPGEHADADGDGIGDLSDPDLDGDGVPNGDDVSPGDPGEWSDLDGDGVGDRADLDDDGDGIADLDEREIGIDPTRVDSDGDRFADGADGFVALPEVADGWDLDVDGYVDGEKDTSDPADLLDHPGKPGDLAPLGHPDARIRIEDASVIGRILGNPGLVDEIPGTNQNRQIAEDALDANEDGSFDAGDALIVIRQATP
jgi:hypothetical protein